MSSRTTLLACLLASVTWPATASAQELAASAGCEGARSFLVDWTVRQLVGGGYYPYYRGGMPPVTGAAPAAANSEGGGGGMAAPYDAGPQGHTATNVQEKGVDEADTVETDGRHIYAIHGREVLIVKSWPAESTDVVARLSFPNEVSPTGLYLFGERLAVLGYGYDQKGFAGTRVMVFDVRDRAAPRLERQTDVEGQMVQSRRVGDAIYLVQNGALRPPEKLLREGQARLQKLGPIQHGGLRPWEQQARLAAYLRGHLLAVLSHGDVEAAMPRIRAGGREGRLACRDLYLPRDADQPNALTLTRVRLGGGEVAQVGLLANGASVYGSLDAIFVSMPHWDWSRWQSQSATVIHKFGLRGADGRPAYLASGTIDGYLLNQFSMSEWRGDLRVATTSQGAKGTVNNLFVMRPVGRTLRTIGAIRGLAHNEQIYSARLIGDKGYLVTFRRTDPLFTLDLRDPARPRVAGELKVNGFSSYIHPLGGDRLLTIGQDADDNGRVLGLHLQVFDVSDPARPRRSAHERMAIDGYSWSPAQYDHHAFTYDPRTRTLALPVHFQGGKQDFTGLHLYRIDRERIVLSGRVAHDQLVAEHLELTCAADAMKAQGMCQDAYRKQWPTWYGGIHRAIIIDDFVYSMGQLGLQVNPLRRPEATLAAVPWQVAQTRKVISLAR